MTGRFGGVIKNWSEGLLFLHTSPQSVAAGVPIDHVACIANMLKPAVQPVLSLLGRCDSCVCVQMAAAVVCLPQTVCRGCDIVRRMCQITAARPGGRRDCVPDGYLSSLTVSD